MGTFKYDSPLALDQPVNYVPVLPEHFPAEPPGPVPGGEVALPHPPAELAEHQGAGGRAGAEGAGKLVDAEGLEGPVRIGVQGAHLEKENRSI